MYNYFRIKCNIMIYYENVYLWNYRYCCEEVFLVLWIDF